MTSEKTANILVFNCGSSSLKYKIIRMPSGEELVTGEAQRVGVRSQEGSFVIHKVKGVSRTIKADLPDHNQAFYKAIELIKEDSSKDKDIYFDVFGHRYVHPGNMFKKTTLVDANALEKLKATLGLAPIHNDMSYKMISICAKEFESIPQFIVFDSSFHSTIPAYLSTYAIPRRLTEKYNLRKIGFHGISHEYIMRESCRFLNKNVESQKIISCHLGTGGSSVCAIEYGKSINNSMGFTPLEGLMMNTRCGDLDLGVVFHMMFRDNLSAQDVEGILNRKSGILGVMASSSDLRDISKNINTDEKAKMVFDMYIKRVKKYITFYSLLLKKADILVFTDSLGIEMPLVREKACEGLGFLGIKLDTKKNMQYKGGAVDLSAGDSQMKVLAIPTEEEAMIARRAYMEFCHGSRS